MIAGSGVEDVRDVLDHYNQEPDPIEAFLLRQQKLLVCFFNYNYSIFLYSSFNLGNRRTKTSESSRTKFPS